MATFFFIVIVRSRQSVVRCFRRIIPFLQLTTDDEPLTEHKKTPPAIASGACKFRLELTFAVLESFASARLAVFLALAHARIASEKSVRLERRTQIGVGNKERARDAVPDRAGLAGGAA